LVNVDFVNKGLRDGTLSGDALKEIYVHAISGCDEFEGLSSSSKLNAEWAFFVHLKDLGRASADIWLRDCYDKVGREGTLDLSGYWDNANALPHHAPKTTAAAG
ncbi:MAG: hypothetical protein ABL908_19350, partial [Hyphomicrobium sp.]